MYQILGNGHISFILLRFYLLFLLCFVLFFRFHSLPSSFLTLAPLPYPFSTPAPFLHPLSLHPLILSFQTRTHRSITMCRWNIVRRSSIHYGHCKNVGHPGGQSEYNTPRQMPGHIPKHIRSFLDILRNALFDSHIYTLITYVTHSSTHTRTHIPYTHHFLHNPLMNTSPFHTLMTYHATYTHTHSHSLITHTHIHTHTHS